MEKSSVHPDLLAAQKLAYEPSDLRMSHLFKEKESEEYGAFEFILNKWLLSILLLLFSCQDQNAHLLDHLSSLKKEFLAEVLEGSIDECPFHLSYDLRTIFYSKQLISLFGEWHQYTHLPHGWTRYEGRTFYKQGGKFTPLTLHHLFPTIEKMEFIRKYCENILKTDPCSYFSGADPLRTTLAFEDLHTFALDHQSLILVFQPYTVAGATDGPPIVRILWTELQGIVNSSHPCYAILTEVLDSKSFISSWNRDIWEGGPVR